MNSYLWLVGKKQICVFKKICGNLQKKNILRLQQLMTSNISRFLEYRFLQGWNMCVLILKDQNVYYIINIFYYYHFFTRVDNKCHFCTFISSLTWSDFTTTTNCTSKKTADQKINELFFQTKSFHNWDQEQANLLIFQRLNLF